MSEGECESCDFLYFDIEREGILSRFASSR